MHPIEELCKFVLSIINSTPKLLKFVDGGAVVNGDFFVWPVDGLADELGVPYYAINPYTGDIYELYTAQDSPTSGIKVSDPELIKIIFDFMNDYLAGYESAEGAEFIVDIKVVLHPSIYLGAIPGQVHSLN